MIEDEPVVSTLMHPVYYLHVIRRRHSRSYTRLVEHLVHEQSLPTVIQRRTNIDDSPGSEALQGHSRGSVKWPAAIRSQHLCIVYFQVIHPHIGPGTMCRTIYKEFKAFWPAVECGFSREPIDRARHVVASTGRYQSCIVNNMYPGQVAQRSGEWLIDNAIIFIFDAAA